MSDYNQFGKINNTQQYNDTRLRLQQQRKEEQLHEQRL